MSAISIDMSEYQGVFTGTWTDNTIAGGYGKWTVDGTDFQGLYQPSQTGDSYEAYKDVNRNGTIDFADKLVALPSLPNKSTGGMGTWSWSVASNHGDYYGSNGQDVGDISASGTTPAEFFDNVKWDAVLGIQSSSIPREGAGEFTTSISLSAGTESTGNLAEGTTVYWKVTGITTDDLTTGSLGGSGIISGGKLDIQHSLKADADMDENFEVSVYSDSGMTQQIGTKSSAAVVEASTYAVTQSQTVSEGETLTTSVQTTNLAQGTKVYWTAGGTGIDGNDFSTGGLTGEATVGADGKFSFSHTLANDNKTEGDETLQTKLYSDSAHTTQVGTTASTIISDTSKTPPTYAVTQSQTASEGETLTTSVQTTNLAQGTKVYWTAGGTGIDGNDFSAGGLTGEATVGVDGKFSFSHTLANDNKTEGDETLQVKLYSDRAHNTQVSTTASTTIVDTSKNPPIVVTKEDGDAHASVNENLARGAHSLIGMRYEKLNVDGDGAFDSDIDSKSDTTATTANGNASTTSRHSLLGIELTSASRIGGEGHIASIVTHESKNEATATNGTSDAEEHLSSVSVDVSDLAIHGKSTFNSYLSVGATNHADASQSRAGVLLTDATATLNQDLAPGEQNITGMRFDRLRTDNSAILSSKIEYTIDTTASSDKGDATASNRNSVLGVGFSGTNSIGGDSRVTSILSHNSFSDAQSTHGTAIADDHLTVIGIEADTLTVHGSATFTSTVVVRAGATSGT